VGRGWEKWRGYVVWGRRGNGALRAKTTEPASRAGPQHVQLRAGQKRGSRAAVAQSRLDPLRGRVPQRNAAAHAARRPRRRFPGRTGLGQQCRRVNRPGGDVCGPATAPADRRGSAKRWCGCCLKWAHGGACLSFKHPPCGHDVRIQPAARGRSAATRRAPAGRQTDSDGYYSPRSSSLASVTASLRVNGARGSISCGRGGRRREVGRPRPRPQSRSQAARKQPHFSPCPPLQHGLDGAQTEVQHDRSARRARRTRGVAPSVRTKRLDSLRGSKWQPSHPET
jgi:hypothetical protein